MPHHMRELDHGAHVAVAAEGERDLRQPRGAFVAALRRTGGVGVRRRGQQDGPRVDVLQHGAVRPVLFEARAACVCALCVLCVLCGGGCPGRRR